jgi:hypothetical protein
VFKSLIILAGCGPACIVGRKSVGSHVLHGVHMDGARLTIRVVLQGGYVILTNRRVVWIDAEAAPAPGRSCSLPLTSVASASKRISFALQSKVRLELHVHVDSYSKPAPGGLR